MAVIVPLTKFWWNRICSTGWALRFLGQKILLFIFSVMLCMSLFIIFLDVTTVQANCQTTSPPESQKSELPDAPSVSTQAQQSPQSHIPFLSTRSGQPLTPLDPEGKFKYLVEPAFGPRAFFTTAIGAGIRMANPPGHYPHEWRAGAEAYGRLYGDAFARTGAESIGRFSASVLLHEDVRYRRSSSTFVPARLGHALAFTFIDRTDGGHSTIAIANFTGAAAGGFIGNAYLPAGFDNLTHAGQRSAIALGGIAGQNVLQEFAPDLAQVLKKLHVPHIPTPPVWWTGDK